MTKISFPYTIKNSSRTQSLRISINSQGKVVLTKPKLIPKIIALKYLESKSDWVEKNLTKINQNKKSSNTIFYLGQKYKIIFSKAKFNFQFKDNKLHLSSYSLESALRNLEKELKEQVRKNIKKSTRIFSQKMNLPYNQIRLKNQSTRWGSCSSKNNLNFNWKLIMAPPEVLDYVVIHELAHLKFMDHSHKFWQFVEKFDPDYRHHRRWLQRNGHNLSL